MHSAISPQPRIEVVDVLRGYALMGLFLIHMVEYFELYWYAPEPSRINSTMFFIFGGKAYAMFALLFGVSFYIIMESQARKGVDFRGRFVWRLAVLLGMGYVHGLIYGGDILQLLAFTGLLLVPLYRANNLVLGAIAAFFILQGPAWIIYGYVNVHATATYAQPAHQLLHPTVFATYAHGTFADVLQTNAFQGQLAKWAFMIESGRVWNIIGLSLLGFLLARNSFFTNTARYRRAYVAGAVVAAMLAALFTPVGADLARQVPGQEARWIIGNIVSAYSNHTWIALSVLGLMLLYLYTPLAHVLRLLAPCGRVSLTIYVSQAFLLVPFFYGFGAGAYAWLGQAWALTFGIVLWCLQVALAHHWIKNYHYGPLEYVWRSATWMRMDIPFRRPTTA